MLSISPSTANGSGSLWLANRHCSACELRARCRGPVPGTGNPQAKLMLVGEAPGQREDIDGRPFRPDAPAGKKLTKLLNSIGINRDDIWLTNLVKCRPSDRNDAPSPKAIQVCAPLWLEKELEQVQPEIVVAVGGTAIRYFLGNDKTVDDTHGIPSMPDEHGRPFVVLPAYHPAAGLHNPSQLQKTQDDFLVLEELMNGRLPRIEDAFPEPSYRWIEDIEEPQWHELKRSVELSELMALDFESEPDGSMFCYSICITPGGAYALPPMPSNLRWLLELCANPNIKKIFHSLITLDYQLLEAYGGKLINFDDTIIRGYELSLSPLGLKPLAKRYLGMHMREYGEIVFRTRRPRALEYLDEVMKREWPNPEPIIEMSWDKKLNHLVEKTKKPQNIVSKAKFRVTKALKDPEYDPWTKWYELEEAERAVVEAELGPMPDVSLRDVAEIYGWDDVIWYAARDADATRRFYDFTEPRIDQLKLRQILEMDLGALPMVVEMMNSGMLIDVPHFDNLANEWGTRMGEAEEEAWYHAGELFKLTSWQQVLHILHEVLHLPIVGKKPATDRETLKLLYEKTQHPVLEQIIEYRRLGKLRNTYAKVLPEVRDERGRVHTTLKVTRTATGRLSSAEPVNLMNQPTRGDEGPRVRDGFLAEEGYVLLAVDLSQIEMRLVAHMSEDPTLIRIFWRGVDMHTATAAETMGLALENVTKDMRAVAKSINFAIVYGESAIGLAHQLGWTVEEAEKYLELYFSRFPRVRQWMEFVKGHALTHGWVEDLWHRRRYIPEVLSDDWKVIERGLRTALNMPVQSSAQIPIKVPMKQLTYIPDDLTIMGLRPHVRSLLQIHDELMFEVREAYWQQLADLVKFRMENALELSVPVLAEAKMGLRWGSMTEYKYENGVWSPKSE